MLELPQIPESNNIYKTVVFLGLVLLLTPIFEEKTILDLQLQAKEESIILDYLTEDVNSLTNETKLLFNKTLLLLDDTESISQETKELEEQFSKYNKKIVGIDFNKISSSELSILVEEGRKIEERYADIKRKSESKLDESKENDNYVNILEEKHNEIRLLLKDSKIRIGKIDVMENYLRRKIFDSLVYRLVGVVLLVAGLILWYINIQIPNENILKKFKYK